MPRKLRSKGTTRHKFGAKPTIVDGIRFASKKEAKRYGELRLLQREGKIQDLRLQVRYRIVIETVYVADFVYLDTRRDETIVEDVKGYRTAEYKRKKRLMRQQHQINIREV